MWKWVASFFILAAGCNRSEGLPVASDTIVFPKAEDVATRSDLSLKPTSKDLLRCRVCSSKVSLRVYLYMHICM
jgi:hypothetical protein